mgnify:CR=1 FL=1
MDASQSDAGTEVALEGSVQLPKDAADLLVAALECKPVYQADIVDSAGAEGGGGVVDVLISLSKPGLGFLAGVLSVIVVRHEVTVTIGQTTIKATYLKRDDMEELISTAFDVESRRMALTASLTAAAENGPKTS